jgi:hypothetical protein
MNQHIVDIVLTFAGTLGLAGVTRFALGQAADSWFHALHDQVDALEPFNCTRFHEIQATPRPWYVKLNTALERRHV